MAEAEALLLPFPLCHCPQGTPELPRASPFLRAAPLSSRGSAAPPLLRAQAEALPGRADCPENVSLPGSAGGRMGAREKTLHALVKTSVNKAV